MCAVYFHATRIDTAPLQRHYVVLSDRQARGVSGLVREIFRDT